MGTLKNIVTKLILYLYCLIKRNLLINVLQYGKRYAVHMRLEVTGKHFFILGGRTIGLCS